MSSIVDNLRVLLVADDPLARAGLAAILADQSNYIIVGQVAGEADLLTELDTYQPDVVVWDLGWQPTAILDRLTELREAKLPVVALLPDETYAAEVWRAGARGLLLRDVNPDRFMAALLAAAQGLATLEPELVVGLLPTDRSHLEPAPLIEELTPRESEVLQILAEGLPNKAIARRLGISEHTVKFHINAIMSKLGVQSRTEAVVYATRLGLILL